MCVFLGGKVDLQLAGGLRCRNRRLDRGAVRIGRYGLYPAANLCRGHIHFNGQLADVCRFLGALPHAGLPIVACLAVKFRSGRQTHAPKLDVGAGVTASVDADRSRPLPFAAHDLGIGGQDASGGSVEQSKAHDLVEHLRFHLPAPKIKRPFGLP